MANETESDVVAVTLRVVRLLEGLGVSYVVVGSLASSVHGTGPRETWISSLI